MECAGSVPVVRVMMLHDGYGLIAAELLNVGGQGPVDLTWIDR
jgi:hypothetical protein